MRKLMMLGGAMALLGAMTPVERALLTLTDAASRPAGITGLSMGFITKKHRLEGKARHLLEVGLHEISLVTVPMHNRTRILSIKDILGGGELPSVRQFEEFLRDAGGFSKSVAAAIATKATPHLRGEPEAKAIDELEQFLTGLRG